VKVNGVWRCVYRAIDSAVLRTVRMVRRRVDDPAAFPPECLTKLIARVSADITHHRHLNYDGPPTISITTRLT
jgi:hypothetical protein